MTEPRRRLERAFPDVPGRVDRPIVVALVRMQVVDLDLGRHQRVDDVDCHNVDDVVKCGIGRDLERHPPGMAGTRPQHGRRLGHVSGRDAVRKGRSVVGKRRDLLVPLVVVMSVTIIIAVVAVARRQEV